MRKYISSLAALGAAFVPAAQADSGVATAVIITRTMAAITVTTVGTVIGVMGVGSLSELALPQSLARPEPMIATAIGVMAIAIATKLIQIDCISTPALKRPGFFSLG